MPTVKTNGSSTQTTSNSSVATSSESDINLAPPAMPELEEFTVPEPKIKTNLERRYKFGYFFGLDDMTFKSKNVNPTCGKITKDIEIGKVEMIELETIYSSNNSSAIEFSIVDQDKEIPIMPIGDQLIENERIFFGLPLRFSIDRSKPYQIKKDGLSIDITPEMAISKNDGIYTITYTPLNAQQYVPISEKVRLKVVMRLYNKSAEAPFIKSALIRAYGGDALWTDRL